jgi:hypothetical protein
MTLVVEAPASCESERRYILDVLIAGWLGLRYELYTHERSDVRISIKGDSTPQRLILPDGLFAVDHTDWLTPRSLPSSPITWKPTEGAGPGPLASCERLPVLYGPRSPQSPLLSDGPQHTYLGVDVFGSAFFMLTRYEELVLGARDGYDRFPAVSSVAHSGQFLGLPVVDAYLELLWSGLQRRWPRLARKPRAFGLSLTHDVDRPLSFQGHNASGIARQLAADVLLRRDLRLAARRLRSRAAVARGNYNLDPYNTFDFLMTISERCGVRSAFYFLAAGDGTRRSGFYSLDDPWIRSLMTTIHHRGHEIGFHAGFDTYCDRQRTAEEYRRLRTATSQLGVQQDSWGGRQHYLIWKSPETWSNWHHAGLDYDSTGFADLAGFRFGTCHEFPTFDLKDRRPLRLRERPLIAMDRTLFRYMDLAPGAAFQAVMGLARECRRYHGTLTLLWHNSSLPTLSSRRWYETLTAALTSPP